MKFWTAPSLPQHDQLVSTLIDAIEIGYRHFNTAAAYGSEEALGQAVAEAIQHGLINYGARKHIATLFFCLKKNSWVKNNNILIEIP